jgi:diguanylate cyclase (GGDEF)-like protein
VETPHWSTQQLAEFLTTVSPLHDPAEILIRGVERAAEAIDADVGAIVEEGSVAASIGFPVAAVPSDRILAVANGLVHTLQVPGAGRCSTLSVPLDEEGNGQLLLGRGGEDGFSPAEVNLVRGMARALSLALTNARSYASAVHRALHDDLTGLPNRTLLSDRLDHALRRASRTGSRVAVLFMDLDNFKTVNDSLGHATGDELLIAVGQRIADSLRAGDTAARLGGDEFALLLEDLDSDSYAEGVGARLLSLLERPFSLGGQDVYVRASIGVATVGGHDLLRNADLAMYSAKSAGKNRYAVFEPGMHDAVVERLELERDLQRALERGELRLEFQPVVRLRTGRAVAVEALLRWDHPSRGAIPPANFIPLAEETRLIVPVGRWVLREACRQAAEWQRLHPALAVSVNLSSVQLAHPGLIEELHAALEETGLDPRSLILEITETVLMVDIESTLTTLRHLKELGIQLAVDDFGTGYSSLQYLRRFPIDILKIDKAFVEGLASASEESALARAIIDLGESFQLRVVAEGIESEHQLEGLLAMGCEYGQGYHFSRPRPPAEIAALLAGQVRDSATS